MHGLRAALPERLRLPGPVGRGRGREGARPQLEARDRGVRPRRVRARAAASASRSTPRCRRSSRSGSASGWTGTNATTRYRHQHRATSGTSSRTCHEHGLALPGPPLDGLVPALRHVALPARARSTPTATSPTRRSTCASRSRAARARPCWSGRRRPGRCRRTSPRPSTRTRTTSRVENGEQRVLGSSRTRVRERCPSRARSWRAQRARSSSVSRTRARSTSCSRRSTAVEHRVIAWDDVGARGGHRHRPHRARLRRRGLRAVARSTASGARADRRGRALLPRVRLAARPHTADARRPDHRRPGRARPPARRGRAHRTATRSAGAAAPSSSSASSTSGSSRRRDPAPDARGERDRRVDAEHSTASGWTTGSATWATGASRASATGGCRCRSTRCETAAT